MPFKFSNAATATLAASIASTSTTLSVAAGLGALFPSLSAGESFVGVLVDSSNNIEIVLVTARTGDLMTIVRAQEGTSARAFSAGSRIEVRLTSAALSNFLQLDGAQTISGQKTFSQPILGNLQGNVTGNVTGSLIGNAQTVTNGVYSVGDQTVAGVKTFSGVTVNSAGRFTTSNNSLAMFEMNLPGQHARAWQLDTSGRTKLVLTDGAGTASTELMGFDASGNSSVAGTFTAAGDITANSDERLKTNWRDLPANFIERLAMVKMGIYDRKDSGDTQAGVGAQDMKKLLPQVVREGIDGMLSVAYGNAALVSAIELAREIVSLRRELNELKGS